MTADRPTTEPRTEAGRRIVKEWLMLRPDYPANTARVRDMVLEAEAEAAQGAAPRAEGLDVERLRAALKSSAEKREWSTEPYAFDQLAEFIAEEYENG